MMAPTNELESRSFNQWALWGLLILGSLTLATISGCSNSRASANKESQEAHARHAEKDSAEGKARAGAPRDARHGEKEEHGSSRDGIVRIDEASMREFGVEKATAGPGKLETTLELTGEISFDPSKVVHVVPAVPGVARKVFKKLGDRVEAGEVLAELASKDLANLAASLLEARAQASLARAEYKREKRLFDKGVSSARDFQRAKAARDSAYAALEAARRRLGALGLTRSDVRALLGAPSHKMSTYLLRAPSHGIVVAKHITRGEYLKANARVFTIADNSVVWANLQVFQRDIGRVRKGQAVIIRAKQAKLEARSVIDYVAPLLGRSTRTARARVILPNPKGLWQPGLFVSGLVVLESKQVPLLVPVTALQTMNGRTCIFVRKGDGWQCRPVALGRRNTRMVEVTAGLQPGTEYIAQGGFVLKSEVLKASFGDDHDH